MAIGILVVLVIAFAVFLCLVGMDAVPGLVIKTKKEFGLLEESHAMAFRGLYKRLEQEQAAANTRMEKIDLLTSQRQILKDELKELEDKLQEANRKYITLQNSTNRQIKLLTQDNQATHIRLQKLEQRKLKVFACRN